MLAQSLRRSKEGAEPLITGVIDSPELTCGCEELNLGSVRAASALTAETYF